MCLNILSRLGEPKPKYPIIKAESVSEIFFIKHCYNYSNPMPEKCRIDNGEKQKTLYVV